MTRPAIDHTPQHDNLPPPIEVSSGLRKIYRSARRGNRRLNHAIHMAAVTQVRHRHSDGRAYYDKKQITSSRARPDRAAAPVSRGPGRVS